MFGIRDLRRRVEYLENTVADLKQDKLCAGGVHKWVARDMSASAVPYVACSHCYKRPEAKP